MLNNAFEIFWFYFYFENYRVKFQWICNLRFHHNITTLLRAEITCIFWVLWSKQRQRFVELLIRHFQHFIFYDYHFSQKCNFRWLRNKSEFSIKSENRFSMTSMRINCGGKWNSNDSSHFFFVCVCIELQPGFRFSIVGFIGFLFFPPQILHRFCFLMMHSKHQFFASPGINT